MPRVRLRPEVRQFNLFGFLAMCCAVSCLYVIGAALYYEKFWLFVVMGTFCVLFLSAALACFMLMEEEGDAGSRAEEGKEEGGKAARYKGQYIGPYPPSNEEGPER